MLQRIETALREDIGTGDITTQCTVPTDLKGQGIFTAKANGVLSGMEVAATVFHLVDDWSADRGALCRRHARTARQ
jgi:nicotinate-nucleotide pyrophosphorylase (carboxylating)